MNPKKKFIDKDPYKIEENESHGFGNVKDARAPFDRDGAEKHFKRTGQGGQTLWGTSNIGQREDAPEPSPDPFPDVD